MELLQDSANPAIIPGVLSGHVGARRPRGPGRVYSCSPRVARGSDASFEVLMKPLLPSEA
jgi:hypothetical protein